MDPRGSVRKKKHRNPEDLTTLKMGPGDGDDETYKLAQKAGLTLKCSVDTLNLDREFGNGSTRRSTRQG